MLKVEMINTGSELLLGYVINTHLAFLARELASLGLSVAHQSTVPDGEPIRAALEQALQRSDLILVTGGLGPTSDDLTRDIAAALLQRKLIFQPEILEKIESYFARRKLTPSDLIRVQAMVPEGAHILPNDWGTAPGLVLEKDQRVIMLLPGPPRELKPMWTTYALPFLRNRFPQLTPLHEKNWRILGMGESLVQQKVEKELRALGEMTIGYCARPGEVDLRIVVENPRLLSLAEEVVQRHLGASIYATGQELLEKVVVTLATQQRRKIAVAESCTGGLVAHRLTNISGSSAVFEFGWVTYGNNAKIQELGVPASLLQHHGAVSGEVAEAMARGARTQSGADLAVALTGVAGPTGGTTEKPVGLIWFSLATPEKTISLKKNLSTDRETFKYMASQMALDLLRRELIH